MVCAFILGMYFTVENLPLIGKVDLHPPFLLSILLLLTFSFHTLANEYIYSIQCL